MHMCVCYVSCTPSVSLVKAQTLYRRTGFMYVSVYMFSSAVRSVVLPSFPSTRGGGGRGLAIADSHHKLDIIGVE
jgi:hypothetical protein